MNRPFVASACALFLVACSKSSESAAPTNPTAGAAATASQVKIVLRKDPI